MRRHTRSALVAAAGLLLTFATRAHAQQPGTQANEVLTVNGCLTARPDGQSFALTPVTTPPVGEAIARTGDDVKPTFTYELIGKPEELRPHAGRLVTARGRVDASAKKSAEVETEQKSSPPSTSGARPQVKVEERAELEVRRLVVSSIASEGKACPATPKS